MGFKLRRAGVDAFIGDAARMRSLTERQSPAADGLLFSAEKLRQALIGKSKCFCLQQELRIETRCADRSPFGDQPLFKLHEFTELLQKPRVNFSQGKEFLIGHAQSHAVGESPKPVGKRRPHGFPNLFGRLFPIQTGRHSQVEAHL